MLKKILFITLFFLTVSEKATASLPFSEIAKGAKSTKELYDLFEPLWSNGMKVSKKISHHFKKKKAKRHAAKHHYVNLLRTASQELEEGDDLSLGHYKKRAKRERAEEELL